MKKFLFIGVAAACLSGCDVRFGHAQYFWGLWGVPLLLLFYAFAARRRAVMLGRFASPEMLPRLGDAGHGQRGALKAGLVVVAYTAAVLALTEPKWGFTWEDVAHRGADVVVALDVSESMLVQDAAQNGKLTRLEQAKREIYDLLKTLAGDRIALVAFAGVAFIECPLTVDYGAAALFLDDMDADMLPVRGTAVGEAIRTALKALDGTVRQSQAVIVITDGEDNSGDAMAAAREAQKLGVRIFTVGIGRDEGAPIPVPGGGFRRDNAGNLVLSKRDESTLQKISQATGGRYVRAASGEMGLESIYQRDIKGLQPAQGQPGKRRQRWHPRFQWLLLGALAALAVEALLPDGAGASKRGAR